MSIANLIKSRFAAVFIIITVIFALGFIGCKKDAEDPESSDQAELNAEGDQEYADDQDYGDQQEMSDEEMYGDDNAAGQNDMGENNNTLAEEGDEDYRKDMYPDEGESSQTDELFADEGSDATGGGAADYGAANAGAASSDTVEYTVARGDTLLKISFKVFRTYYKWKELLKYNPGIADPNIIEIGQKIYYPGEYQQRVTAAYDDEYRIQRGDTLGTISERFYGTPEHWRKIAELNPEKIINPNEIFAGTTIKVSVPGLERAAEQSYGGEAEEEATEDESAYEEEAIEDESAYEEEATEEESTSEGNEEESYEEDQEDA